MHADDLFKTPSSDAWQELAYPLEAELEWLSAQGVAPEVMAEPWPLRSAGVVFDDLYGFDFKRDGEPAIIFKAEDRGDELDLIAWEVSTGRLASWHGNTFCLGDLDQIGSPATYFMDGALRIHASPLEWLMAQREGIVILRQEFAYALSGFPRALFATIWPRQRRSSAGFAHLNPPSKS